jgi:hypothetical protein
MDTGYFAGVDIVGDSEKGGGDVQEEVGIAFAWFVSGVVASIIMSIVLLIAFMIASRLVSGDTKEAMTISSDQVKSSIPSVSPLVGLLIVLASVVIGFSVGGHTYEMMRGLNRPRMS